MKLSKQITTRPEPFDFDIQLVATELDTAANYLRYLSKDIIEDLILHPNFDRMVNDIESGQYGAEIESFDDNTVMYEFQGEPIVVINTFGEKTLLYDSLNVQKFERILLSYKE